MEKENNFFNNKYKQTKQTRRFARPNRNCHASARLYAAAPLRKLGLPAMKAKRRPESVKGRDKLPRRIVGG